MLTGKGGLAGAQLSSVVRSQGDGRWKGMEELFIGPPSNPHTHYVQVTYSIKAEIVGFAER